MKPDPHTAYTRREIYASNTKSGGLNLILVVFTNTASISFIFESYSNELWLEIELLNPNPEIINRYSSEISWSGGYLKYQRTNRGETEVRVRTLRIVIVFEPGILAPYVTSPHITISADICFSS